MATIGDLSHRDAVTAKPTDTLTAAALRMHQHQVGCLIVVHEEDSAQVVGILTDRDIVVRGVAHSARPTTQIHNLMSEPVQTCQTFESISLVLRRMEEAGIRRVPVLDGGQRLVGVVAFEDLLDHLSEELARMAALSRNERQREATGAA